MIKNFVLLALFGLSIGAYAINFSNNSPLPEDVKEQMTELVAQKCNASGLLVVESRTLVTRDEGMNGDVVDKYFTTLAALTPQTEVYALIEILTQIEGEAIQQSILNSPICIK